MKWFQEGAAASEELASQAELLKEQVGRFKLKREAQQSSHRRMEEGNHDGLRMLESMSKNNKLDENMNSGACEAVFASSRKFL